ncbi:polysaccharide pyruvyl transferase family protein [Saccharomonospora xinjiangensis]|uniref:polysaccharide pyruvyl transferase family protein n=1 Tax=Saccharomonospora xinjiangensis TaxID=75294 RepID=UPI00106FE684|nr:polysaccharide pyruvyl transferase family protein [Saccharomonospora xinjiangensis]QBQ59603.1 Polysaccharide pyruvyl transferase [Saccharomonospora xinjiangensis]
MRVLVTGWPSFLHGEATAGDVLSMRRVADALDGAGIGVDTAWSPTLRPGALHLDDADPARYTHLVFACGPAHGEQVEWLHHRYAACRRIAVGVSVIDPRNPAAAGFHRILARDGLGETQPDLSYAAHTDTVPVAGIMLAPGQYEYGGRRRHEQVHKTLLHWVTGLDCARVSLDTRLDSTDWRHCATPDQFLSLVARLDVVVTTRMHGLVLALRAGVPAIAVDPVAGGGKVTAQGRALGWPAVVGAEEVGTDALDRWWRWCVARGVDSGARTPPGCQGTLVAELLGEVLR